MFRQVSTLASHMLKTGSGVKGQIKNRFHSMSYALPFGNNKMGAGCQSSGGIPDREALWERCGKDDRTFNALFKRYDGDLKSMQDFLDSVKKGWMAFRIDSDGALVTRLTDEGSEENARRAAEIHRESVY